MTDTPDTTAARVQAYLDAFDDPEHPQGAISTLRSEGLRLTVADLRAVLAEHQQMRDELARYTDRYQEWGVRLIGGTHIDCRGEEDAREKAKAYHGVPRVCDVLSTDWRDADTADATNQQPPDGPR